MAEQFVERNLFVDPSSWISNKSDSINKPQSAFFEASQTPNSMLVTNGLIEAWAGALVSNTRQPLVAVNGKLMNWLAFRLQFMIPENTFDNLARLETDLKVCVKTRPDANTKIRNVANFSSQWNADTGQFQIDKDPPAWTNTGFVVDLQPSYWHTLEYRYWFDETNLVFSVLSIQLDDQLYMIPDSLQNVPMSLTNWEKTRKLQLQTEGYQPKSSVLVQYMNGELAWSTERITQIPPLSERHEREVYSRVDMPYGEPVRGDWTQLED